MLINIIALAITDNPAINKLVEKPVILEVKATSESKSMSDTNKYNLQNFQLSGDVIGTNCDGNQIGTQQNHTSQQNLAEAAQDIQQLLKQLERSYPNQNDLPTILNWLKSQIELKLNILEEKYQAALKVKDEEIAAQRQENAYLRQLAEKLAKTPIAINLNQEAEQT